MTVVKVGQRYNVSMKGEPEFGGPMVITAVTARQIKAAFSFKKRDPIDYDDVLCFTQRKNAIHYKGNEWDGFPNAPVQFKRIGGKVKKLAPGEEDIVKPKQEVVFIEWFEESEHSSRKQAQRVADRLAKRLRTQTRVEEKFGKFFVMYKDRLLSQGEIV